MREIPEVTEVDLAFPAEGIDIAPPLEEIPEAYQSFTAPSRAFFRDWFSGRIDWESVRMFQREGVDARKAFDALNVIAGCYGLKHEHKEAAIAFLVDEWFLKVEWKNSNEDRTHEHVAPDVSSDEDRK